MMHLSRSVAGSYAWDAYVIRSKDDGGTWGDPRVPTETDVTKSATPICRPASIP
jgi:hypothetical protein